MSNFNKHWEHVEKNDIPVEKSYRARSFLGPFFQELNARNDLQPNLRVLDAGCGDGVHAIEIQKYTARTEYHGIDISETAIRISKQRVASQNFHFKTTDIVSTGYPSKYFDIVISYGVIAYTSDPKDALFELYRVTVPGGLIGIWVKTENNLLRKSLFSLLRTICTKSTLITKVITSLIIPFMKYLPINSGVNLTNSSWSQCEEVVLVNLAPEQLVIPSNAEVLEWISELGGQVIKQGHQSGFEVWLRKS